MRFGRSPRTGARPLILPALALLAFLAVPAAVLAAAGDGGGWRPVYDLVMRIVNFTILLAVLIHYARRPIVEGIRNSIESVRRMLQEAEQSRREAEERMREAEERLAGLDREIEELLEAAKREGETERERIVAEAEAAVQKLKKEAAAAIEQELKKSKAILRREAAEAAVALAEELLREKVTPEDHGRFIAEYLEKLEGVQ